MKAKRNLLIAIASVLAATGMASCGEQPSTTPASGSASVPGDSSDSSISTSLTYAMPVISRDAPKEVAVGEEIDLDKYVTVDANGGYELSVVTGDVTINGHKFVANALGTVEIKVQSGTYKKIFETKAVSAEKIAYGKIIDTLANNYTCKVYGNDTYMGYAMHTDYGWLADYSAADSTSKPEGLALLSDQKWYSFNYDAETQQATFPPQSPVANGDLYFLSMAFTLNSLNFVDAYDGNGDVILDRVGNTTVTTDVGIDLHYNRNDGSGTYAALVLSGLSFTSADFDTFIVSMDKDADGDVLVFEGAIRQVNADKSVTFKTGKTAYRFEISKIGKTAIPSVQAYIAAGTIPEPLDISKLSAKFAAINQAKNMTVTSSSGWFDGSGNPVAAPTVENGSVEDYGFWDYTSVAKFTEQGASYVNSGSNMPGVYEIGKNPADENSPWYVYSKNGEEAAETIEVTNASFDLWNLSGMPDVTDARLSNMNVQGVSEDATGWYRGYDKTDLYDDISAAYSVDFSDEDSGNILVGGSGNATYNYDVIVGAINAPVDLRYNMDAVMGANYKYFDFSNLFIFANGDFGFEFSIRWETNTYFCVFSRISDIGTTVLPDDFMANADFENTTVPDSGN